MITKQYCLDTEHLPSESARPPIPKNWRKVLFFIFREGPILTFRKIFTNYISGKRLERSIVRAKIDGKFDAISYDDGNSYYVSSIDTTDYAWRNPFSYDYIAEISSVEIPQSIPVNALFCIGFGNYPRVYSIPQFARSSYFCCVDYNDRILERAENSFRLKCNDILQCIPAWQVAVSPIAIICSYHSDHAKQAKLLYNTNHSGVIFIEKPPIVDLTDIDDILSLYERGANFEIGFNRRYAPFTLKAKKYLSDKPKIITISVNEVVINQSHWYFWENQGTRITGNACHWIDLCQFFIDSIPISVTLSSSTMTRDDVSIIIRYEDGSLATLSLSDKGNQLRGVQEFIEIRENNLTIRIEDFVKLTAYSDRYNSVSRSLIRDKGHLKMYKEFNKNIKSEKFETKYPLRDFIIVSLLTYHCSFMLANGECFYSIDWSSEKYNNYLH